MALLGMENIKQGSNSSQVVCMLKELKANGYCTSCLCLETLISPIARQMKAL